MRIPTRSFERPRLSERSRELPRDVHVDELCKMARAAGLLLLTRSGLGTDRLGLRSWLVLDYEGVTVFTSVGEPLGDDPTAGLDDEQVELLVQDARARVLGMLATASDAWSATSFADEMIDSRLVVRVRDQRGACGYAPLAHPEMRLVDRLASLFIADFLTCPRDYAYVAACETCGDVTIGARLRHLDWCMEPPTQSGVMARARPSRVAKRTTLKGVGEAFVPEVAAG